MIPDQAVAGQAPSPSSTGPLAAAIGAVVAGLAAVSCCVMPLVFVFAGISGMWIANLTALSPYQPIFIAAAVAAITYGHVSAYRARKACAAGAVCSRPMPRWIVDGGLWVGTVLVLVALAVNTLGPYLL